MIFALPVIDGLSYHDAKVVVKKYIESILNYNNYKKQTRLIDNDIAKEFTSHQSNENRE
jgi:hypothetical protein